MTFTIFRYISGHQIWREFARERAEKEFFNSYPIYQIGIASAQRTVRSNLGIQSKYPLIEIVLVA